MQGYSKTPHPLIFTSTQKSALVVMDSSDGTGDEAFDTKLRSSLGDFFRVPPQSAEAARGVAPQSHWIQTENRATMNEVVTEALLTEAQGSSTGSAPFRQLDEQTDSTDDEDSKSDTTVKAGRQDSDSSTLLELCEKRTLSLLAYQNDSSLELDPGMNSRIDASVKELDETKDDVLEQGSEVLERFAQLRVDLLTSYEVSDKPIRSWKDGLRLSPNWRKQISHCKSRGEFRVSDGELAVQEL